MTTTTALVLIDLQNDYFPGGAMELVAAEDAVAQARTLLDAFRTHQLPVFHIQHIAKRPGATFFLPGTTGANIHPAVQPLANEAVITKHFPSSFRETALLDGLRAVRASKLVLAGMMTHMCVDTTVRAAADLGFECVLAEDGCATRALQFSGSQVDAQQVQLAYLAALNGAFAKVQPARNIAADLQVPP
jgi:nicotinamidase-related amidase